MDKDPEWVVMSTSHIFSPAILTLARFVREKHAKCWCLLIRGGVCFVRIANLLARKRNVFDSMQSKPAE